MKKLTRLPARQVLSIILLLIAALFISTKADAQTREECDKTRARASYNCLTGWTKCYYPCTDRTKDVSACYKTCKQAEDACDKQVDADYKACLGAQPKAPAVSEAEKQLPSLEKEKQENQSETSKAKKEAPKQTPPVFIGEWFSRFSKAIDGLIVLPGVFEAVLDNKFYIAPDVPDLSELTLEEMFQGHWYPDKDEEDSYRPPTLTTEEEQRAWAFLPNYIPDEENVTVIKGQSEIKMPTSSDFIPIPSKGGDTLKVTYLDSTVRSTSDMVQLGYTWSADSGSVINVPKWSEVKFRKPVEVEGFTSHTVELGQGEIEVRVRNSKPAENQFGVDAGWLGVTVSRTHFWISQSQDKKMAVIGVYEGEVEVKTKEGKTIKVAPDGDKPGVAVVSQKLSPVKLALVGLVLAAAVGGVVWFIKKKTSIRPSKKR